MEKVSTGPRCAQFAGPAGEGGAARGHESRNGCGRSMTSATGVGFELAPLFPLTAQANAAGHLEIGGCDVAALAAQYGTPLYLYDELTIREICREYRREFGERLPGARVLYAAKAYLGPALAALLAEEGLGLDAVSGGELFVALAGGMPAARIALHGNNKSEAELREALAAGVGRVVVDNADELALLDRLAAERGVRQAIMLRLTPGVDAHTHAKTSTGVLDSKFGFPLEGGAAEAAVAGALAATGLELTGFHIHLGSPIYETAPYVLAIEAVGAFAAAMRERHGFVWREFSPGGGFAVTYTCDRPSPAVAQYAEAVAGALRATCERQGLPLPEVHLEPGRAIVARAGVALYRVGAGKEIPGGRRYVAVDGGMADNIRPALYGARYTAVAASRLDEAVTETVRVAGRFCESGDVLIDEVRLPRLAPGDLLAVPASGAYTLAMESNYNLTPRPAVLFLHEGAARLVRRRQSYEDLLALEVGP